MWLERFRKLLLIPSRSQWRKSSLFSKQTTVSAALTVIGLVITIYVLVPTPPKSPPPKAYDLNEARHKEFLELLKTSQYEPRDTLKIGCVSWSEVSCLAAGKFLTLFSEAGWRIESDRVYMMTPDIPVDGVTIATQGEDIANLPKLPPHLGRWARADRSTEIITMAFRYMDNPVNFSSDPSLSTNELGIYFGPEPQPVQNFTPGQKEVRKPLLSLFSKATMVRQTCYLDFKTHCNTQFDDWQSEVLSYLQNNGFAPASIKEWQLLSTGTKGFTEDKMKAQENLLIVLLFGLK